jgi:DNA-binding beta-propeller fold protein YncE
VGIRNISLRWLLYSLLVCLSNQTSRAEKTLFSIDSHASPVAVRAYEIEGSVIKAPVTISEDLFGFGPVGAAVSEELGLLFVTYEAADIVPVFRCRTLLKVADVDTDVSNLAGIAADDSKDKIYILQRNTRNLYVYTWNETTDTLDLESQEDLVGLPSPYTGTGIALDGEYLYVTDTSDTVRCFDTTNWKHQNDKDITLPQGNNAWSIAIYHHHNLFDFRYGYFGGYTSHNNLVRVDLNDPNDYIIVTPSETYGERVNGIAVDPNSGLVYASIDDGSNRVFDTSLNELYSIDTNVSGPAGMAVGNRYYSPFKIEKSDDVDDNDCASPQMGEITYAICYDYQWDNETDPDPCEFDSLSIIDYLSKGVDFVNSIVVFG